MALGNAFGAARFSSAATPVGGDLDRKRDEEIAQRRAHCPDATCPLRASWDPKAGPTGPVPPAGARLGRKRSGFRGSVALVGEGPGRHEMQRGVPFVGPSGMLLKWLLECARAPSRENLHITNAAMCMPTSVEYWEDDERITVTKQATLEASVRTHCRPRLLTELERVRPKVILAVGGYALESLTGRSGVLKHHGAVIDSSHLGWPCWTVPMLHPAALLRNAKNTDAVVMVLQKAFRIAEEGKPRFRGDRVIITPRMPGGASKAYAMLCFWVDTLLAEGNDLSIDVETTNEDARNAALTVFGFGSVPRANGVAVSMLTWNRALGVFEPTWQPPFDELVHEQITRVVSCRLRKWYWNYRFDVTVLERDFPETRGPHADGMHLHWLMQPELEHNLAFAVQSMVDTPPWKIDFWSKQNAGEATDDDLLEYNADDVINTARIVEPLKHATEVRGNDHLVEHQMRVAELARRAEAYGVPVCRETWRKLYDEYEAKQQACLEVMRKAIRNDENAEAALTRSVHRQRCADARKRAEKTGKYNPPQLRQLWSADFAPRSPYHARWYLYEFARIRPERFTAGGEEGTNKKTSTSYKGVLGYLKNLLVKAYVDFSEWDAKLVYLRAVERHCIVDEDGWWRLYVSWSTTGMKGTRWTSKVVNMQNWEKKLRKVLRAKPGRCWVGADASQIEYRIAAALAGLEPLIELFNAPPFDEHAEEWKKYDGRYDAHSLVAEMVFGDIYKQGSIEDKGTWRTLVKRVVYAMFYGAHPEKILTSLREDRRLPSALRATLSLQRIEKIWRTFKEMFPAWDAWAQKEMDLATRLGYQTFPPFGRRRWWRQQDIEENKIRNTPIQLAAGDVCNLIFCNIQDRVDEEGLDSQMTIHGHDAIYLDTAECDAERVCEIVNEAFHYMFPGPGGAVHIYGQASIGPSVGDVG